MNAYDFTVKAQDGADVSLSEFKGKVLLIVNTATECGFTPQYEDLQELYSELAEKGLEILDFPCNQFAGQAPGSDDEIHTFCTGRFGVTFPQYSKVNVNGADAVPLYQWLTSNTVFSGFSGPAESILAPVVREMDPDYENNGNIKWNFTKFIIDRNGKIAARFEPTAGIDEVRAGIEEVL